MLDASAIISQCGKWERELVKVSHLLSKEVY